MKTLPILNSMLVLASGAGLSAQQANAQQKPHIILIMTVPMLWDVWEMNPSSHPI